MSVAPPPEEEGAPDGEFALIARWFRPLAAAPAALGLADDAALLTPPPGESLAITMDTIVAGAHFLSDDPPESVGIKLLGVNLSDLAAMGARPLAWTLSAALPQAWTGAETAAWLEGFVAGLARMQRDFGIALIGGDTVATPGALTLTATAIGAVAPDRALTRAGAREGDVVWASGTIGDGALGLLAATGLLAADDWARLALIDRYRHPRPRVALGRAIAGLATAAIDVSDGLAADLGHLCRASGVSARIDVDAAPLSAAARAAVERSPGLIEAVLFGGDDYELVFTAPEAAGPAVLRAAASAGTPVAAIGGVEAAENQPRRTEVRFERGGAALTGGAAPGFDHFRRPR